MKNELVVALIMVCLIVALVNVFRLVSVPTVYAKNVKSIDSIKVDCDGDGVAEEELSLTSHESISIPTDKKIHIVEVKGTAKNKDEEVGIDLLDEDGWFRFRDDRLDSKKVSPNPDGTFTVKLEVWCKTGDVKIDTKLGKLHFKPSGIEGPGDSSGEQRAEIYIKDGDSKWPSKDDYWTFCNVQFSSKFHFEIGKAKIINLSRTNLYIPAYSLSEPVNFTENIDALTPSPYQVPSGFEPIIQDFDLGPTNVVFVNPIMVFVYYTDEEIEGIDESTLRIFRFDPTESCWIPEETLVDATNNLLIFNTTRLGTFGFTGVHSVGGITIPIDKPTLFAPWFVLAIMVVTFTIGAVFARKRWFRKAVVQKP